MRQFAIRAVTVLTAGLFFLPGSEVLAQKPILGKSTSLICKISMGGQESIRGGFVLITLTNITPSTIPKGKTLFASKDNVTIKFRTPEVIPQNGNVTFKTTSWAFKTTGDCLGWYN